MTGYRVPPLKVTAYVGAAPVERLDICLQGLLSGDRDYRLNGVQSFGRRDVKQYAVFDTTGRYRPTDRETIAAGIEKLFDTQYFPVSGQRPRSNLNGSRVPPNGATLTVGYRRDW